MPVLRSIRERFADRWTVFFGDMLRIRSGAEGGTQFTAYIHKALETGMPYDELCRRLISANGKPGRTPEVGYILGDGADPMALAASTYSRLRPRRNSART